MDLPNCAFMKQVHPVIQLLHKETITYENRSIFDFIQHFPYLSKIRYTIILMMVLVSWSHQNTHSPLRAAFHGSHRQASLYYLLNCWIKSNITVGGKPPMSQTWLRILYGDGMKFPGYPCNRKITGMNGWSMLIIGYTVQIRMDIWKCPVVVW